jgi:hypothetical protein
MDVWSNFLWAAMHKCLKALQAILSQLIIFLSAVPNNQRHNSFNVLTKPMACLSTAEQDIEISTENSVFKSYTSYRSCITNKRNFNHN